MDKSVLRHEPLGGDTLERAEQNGLPEEMQNSDIVTR